jgi:glycosyltransferase involved in cell wall biosynthesis
MTRESAGAFRGKSVLFITPCFLARRLHKEIRGVEIFDLLLVRRLVELGVRVTVGAESSWRARLETHLAGAMPEVLYTPSLIKPLWNGLALAPRLRRRRFDALLLGNVGNGVGAVARLVRRRCARVALIAHREPRAAFLRSLRGSAMDVVAVNSDIAGAFDSFIGGRVTVRYGIPNAERFHPAPARAGDGVTRFVMLGRLDTPIKRVHLAIEAFQRLPDEVRRRCELHLAGYPDPPRNLPQGVVAYGWQTVDEIAALLRRMDVGLVTSESETFSQAMVQTMLTGLPSVVGDLPALVEKTAEGSGIVARTPDELREAMALLAGSPDLRRTMGAAARRLALSRYVWDTEWFAREHLFPADH